MHRDVIDEHLAGRRQNQPNNHSGERRFAGTRFADQRQRLTPRDVKCHIGNRRDDLSRRAFQQAVEPGSRDIEHPA